jgi:predicted exporter
MRPSRRWLWILLLVPIGLGLMRLRFDVEVLNLLPKGSDVVQGLKLYQEHFSSGSELLLTIKSDQQEKSEAAARTIAEKLRSATNLVAGATWQAPWLEHPAEAAELLAYLWINQPPNVFSALTNRLMGTGLTNTLLETREQLASSFSPEDIARRAYDPLGLMNLPEEATAGAPSMSGAEQFFASADGTFRVVFVEPAGDVKHYRRAKEWLDSLDAVIKKAQTAGELPADIRIGWTGSPVFVSEVAHDMEGDITSSVIGTAVVIAGLFWFAHRRVRPLLWLLVLLAVILGITMAAGGLLFGTLNVISLGFAAILLGLAVDYGLVLFQEAKVSAKSVEEIRREIGPSIAWAALTSAGAFALLNISGLPGLAQLGSLVAIGTATAAFVMVFAYLPPLANVIKKDVSNRPEAVPPVGTAPKTKLVWAATLIIAVIATGFLMNRPPSFDSSPEALRPRHSQAYETLQQIKQELGGMEEPLWLIVRGKNEEEVATLLKKADAALQKAVTNKLISSYTLATTLWPEPNHQAKNRETLQLILRQQDNVRKTAFALDFAPSSLGLTEQFFRHWERALQVDVFWPTNRVSRWAMEKVSARSDAGFLALGLIQANTNAPASAVARFVETWPKDLAGSGAILSGWTLLGSTMFDLVRHEFLLLFVPMFVLILVTLRLAFRGPKEVVLSVAALLFSGLCLSFIMSFAGWSWNLMNLMAAPLLLGVGVDYTIHMQLALKRHHGNLEEVNRTTRRALLLCGGTTVAGFGSLAFSSNAGMASLGQVCSAGIAACMVTSLYLLPGWWKSFRTS